MLVLGRILLPPFPTQDTAKGNQSISLLTAERYLKVTSVKAFFTERCWFMGLRSGRRSEVTHPHHPECEIEEDH
jgi:hypothetical protein